VRKLAVAGAVVAVAGGLVAWRAVRAGDQAESAVPTAVVVKEKLVRRITAEGNLKAVSATPISPPPPRGRPRPMKIAWMAPDGSRVAAGEVVLRFDPTDFDRQLKDGDADLAAAGAKLTRENVQAGAAEDNREASANMAEMELDKTRKFQPKDEEIFSRHEIIESTIDESLSRAKMEHAREAEAIEKKLTRSKLALIQVEKKKAELAIQQARAGLEAIEVKAPHAGILVFQRDWRGELPHEGEQVWPGQTVAEIPILEEMEAQVYVLEVDGGGLEPGIKARVVLEARPDVEYEAVVKQVDDLAQPRIHDLPVQYFAMTLSLAKTDEAVMKPGGRVRATLILDKDAALVVPRQAIVEQGGVNLVYRLEDGVFRPVEVELGASTPGRVVIEKGLAAGDRVALRDPTRSLDEKKAKPGEPAARGGAPEGGRSP
jgi:multidrug efflux pump subunit AcrA (membrane-fusion protein)